MICLVGRPWQHTLIILEPGGRASGGNWHAREGVIVFFYCEEGRLGA